MKVYGCPLPKMILLPLVGVLLCCTGTAGAAATATTSAAARNNHQPDGSSSSDIDRRLSEATGLKVDEVDLIFTTRDPADLLLKDFVAAIREEEALLDDIDPDKTRVAKTRAMNQDMLDQLKPVVMTLFDSRREENHDMSLLIFEIFARERGGGVNRESKLKEAEFRTWFEQKLKLADILREKRRMDIEHKQRMYEMTGQFWEDLGGLFKEMGDKFAKDAVQEFREKIEQEERMQQIIWNGLNHILSVCLVILLYRALFVQKHSHVNGNYQ